MTKTIWNFKTHPLRGVLLFSAITIAFHVLWRMCSSWAGSENPAWLFQATWFGEHLWDRAANAYTAMAGFTTRQAYLAAALINELLMGDNFERLGGENLRWLEGVNFERPEDVNFEQLDGDNFERPEDVNFERPAGVNSTFVFHAASPAGTQIRQLIIDHTCSGLKQFYQAFFLFLLYPGPWKHKAWFIPMAVAVMHLVNVFRIVVLSLVMLHAYHQWDIIHDWVVRPMFYVVLFGLWVWWDQRSGG